MARTPRTSKRPTVTRAEKRQRLASATDTVNCTVLLPRDLHERLFQASHKLNWTMGEVIRQATEAWLTTHERTVTS
jgi:hypothetical protein